VTTWVLVPGEIIEGESVELLEVSDRKLARLHAVLVEDQARQNLAEPGADRPGLLKAGNARRAFTHVSCTRSSASCAEPFKRIASR